MPHSRDRFLPLALRLGVGVAAGYAFGRIWSHCEARAPGYRSQLAEDALEALPEGLTLHQGAADAADPLGQAARQRQATLRLRRSLGFAGQVWELDWALLTRLRLTRRGSEGPRE